MEKSSGFAISESVANVSQSNNSEDNELTGATVPSTQKLPSGKPIARWCHSPSLS